MLEILECQCVFVRRRFDIRHVVVKSAEHERYLIFRTTHADNAMANGSIPLVYRLVFFFTEMMLKMCHLKDYTRRRAHE